MKDTEDINVDLLIVTDLSDTLTLYALHILCALQSVFKNYTVDSRKIYNVNERFTCKKVLFITWGFTKYTRTKVTKWLNELKIGYKRRFIINVTGDSYGKPLETLEVNDIEFCDQNNLKVHQIKHVENWWPHTLQFLLDLSRPKKSIFKYHLRQSESIFKETVCLCLDYFNIERSDEELRKLEGCNIGLVKEFPTADKEERNTIYLSDNFAANPITKNHYKWDQVILFITRIYVETEINESRWKYVLAYIYVKSSFLYSMVGSCLDCVVTQMFQSIKQLWERKFVRIIYSLIGPILSVAGITLFHLYTKVNYSIFMVDGIQIMTAIGTSIFIYRQKTVEVIIVCVVSVVINVAFITVLTTLFDAHNGLHKEPSDDYGNGDSGFAAFIVYTIQLAFALLNVTFTCYYHNAS